MIERLFKLEFETARLRIRPVEKADLKAIYAMHSIDKVNEFIPYNTWTEWQDAEDWFAEKVEKRREEKFGEQFVIADKTNGELVGTCLAFDYQPSNQSLEVGYVLAPKHWGKGIMFEAISCFVNQLLAINPVKTLIASIERENHASLRLIERLGFEQSSELQNDDPY